MSESANIVVSRPWRRLQDRVRAYRVSVDGVTVGRLRNGEQATFGITPGAHAVHVSIDGLSSPPLLVELASGESAALKVGYNGSSFELSQLWRRNAYLTLIRTE